jgi:large subunit ribosomal protein L25
MNIVQISTQGRADVGSKSAAKARREGSIPAVIYGLKDPVHVLVTWGEVRHAIYTPDFKLVDVNVDGKDHRCIVKDVQFDAVNESILHIDFLALNEGVPVKVEVPLRFKGTSIGVKNGGKLVQQMRKLKLKTTPDKIVDEVRVDISHLELGAVLRIKSVEVNEGVTVLANAQTPIAYIEIPRALKSAAAAEAKAATKGKKK